MGRRCGSVASADAYDSIFYIRRHEKSKSGSACINKILNRAKSQSQPPSTKLEGYTPQIEAYYQVHQTSQVAMRKKYRCLTSNHTPSTLGDAGDAESARDGSGGVEQKFYLAKQTEAKM